jgi:hypothetical protein
MLTPEGISLCSREIYWYIFIFDCVESYFTFSYLSQGSKFYPAGNMYIVWLFFIRIILYKLGKAEVEFVTIINWCGALFSPFLVLWTLFTTDYNLTRKYYNSRYFYCSTNMYPDWRARLYLSCYLTSSQNHVIGVCIVRWLPSEYAFAGRHPDDAARFTSMICITQEGSGHSLPLIFASRDSPCSIPNLWSTK